MKYCLNFILIILISCHSKQESPETGKQLATIHCGSCHDLPDPSLLDKNSWRKDIMPAMARKMGIDFIYEAPLVTEQDQSISVEDFKKIATWYANNAPDSLMAQNRPPVSAMTNLFRAKHVIVPPGQFPSTSYVKIDPARRRIYCGNAFDSSLGVYDTRLIKLATNPVGGILVDMDFSYSPKQAGVASGIYTLIGMMNPNDIKNGSVHSFAISREGTMTYSGKLFDSLPRPVQTLTCDLDVNGKPDYVVCGFGNKEGALSWVRINNDNAIDQQALRSLPGAIKAYSHDFNRDGHPDIIALMAQAYEGIYLFSNKGGGHFEERKLLSFPVIYGSSYFELDDFNHDGLEDILYTCGDNADYTGNTLKNYHGVYIFLQDQFNHFEKKFFFPIHGCYKAMARDFDKDGDLDIACISYFPDRINQARESFVYLEQTTFLQFSPYTINEFDDGRWLTMDAADADGDGDDDIVLGSLIPPYKEQLDQWKLSGKQKTALLFLENTHH